MEDYDKEYHNTEELKKRIEAAPDDAEGYSDYRGHPTYVAPGPVVDDWRYLDGVSIYEEDRPCPRCGEPPTEDGHDACLANIPGAQNACCGHGVKEGYIQYPDRTIYISKRKPEKEGGQK